MRRVIQFLFIFISLNIFAVDAIKWQNLRPQIVFTEKLYSEHTFTVLYAENVYYSNPLSNEDYSTRYKPSVLRTINLLSHELGSIQLDFPINEKHSINGVIQDVFDDHVYVRTRRNFPQGETSWFKLHPKTSEKNILMDDPGNFGPVWISWPTLEYRFNEKYKFKIEKYIPDKKNEKYYEVIEIINKQTKKQIRSWVFQSGFEDYPIYDSIAYYTWIGDDWILIDRRLNKMSITGINVEFYDETFKSSSNYLAVYNFVQDYVMDFGDEFPIGNGLNSVVSIGKNYIGFSVRSLNGEIFYHDPFFDLLGPVRGDIQSDIFPTPRTINNVIFDGCYIVYKIKKFSGNNARVEGSVILDLLNGNSVFLKGDDANILGLF